MDDKTFLGQGWAFPVQTDPSGEVALVVHEEDVRQAIQIILGTVPGERVMRQDFGAGLQALVFEPLNTTTMALAKVRVKQALIAWEPRIDNIAIHVSADRPQGRMLIDIKYRVRLTNTFYNLVYPFYLLEAKLS